MDRGDAARVGMRRAVLEVVATEKMQAMVDVPRFLACTLLQATTPEEQRKVRLQGSWHEAGPKNCCRRPRCCRRPL